MGVVVVTMLGVAMTPLDAATPKRDYASAAWSVLPPGENGSLTFNRNTRDQAALYDGLRVLGGNVDATRHPPLLQACPARAREGPRAGRATSRAAA